ncbi:MAG: Ig-like domain-containing protein [Caldilineaceae bacterium]
MYHRRRDRLIALILAIALCCQPFVAHAQEGVTYLPLLRAPEPPPAIAVTAPYAGSTVGGVFVFAVSPTSAATIQRVEFRAGDTVLGEDLSAHDGFSILVESRNLPAGQTVLSAHATGPGGQGSDDVIVQLVANPATNTVSTANGDGVFASETGSVITLRPGATMPDQPIFVDELTQAEVTQQHNIDWEAMGVTFLGAQEISAEMPITLPLAGVTSAGFAERVQPGQAIVNYRLQPDADGDGVSEIVVVNTASIAANGDVVADAVTRPTVFTERSVGAAAALSGPPGFLLDIPVGGFNVHAGRSNRAVFTTLTEQVEVAGSVYVDPERPTQQIFRVAIPYMQPGAATVVLRNETVVDAADPLPLTIEALPPLTRPADEVFDELFDTYAEAIARKVASLLADAEPARLAVAIKAGRDLEDKIAELKAAYGGLYDQLSAAAIPEPEVRAEVDKVIGHMNSAAAMVEANGVARLTAAWLDTSLTASAVVACRQPFTPDDPTDNVADFIQNLITPPYIGNSWANYATLGLTAAAGVAVAVGASAATITTLTVLAGAAGAVVVAEAAATLVNDLFRNVNDGLDYANQQDNPDCPQEPPPCPPGQSNNGPTGMGSAPPPGGNGCGGAGGASGGLGRAATASLAGRIAVKIYVNGNPTPFSGLTDAGGYFFVPFIPQGETFTAIAFDRETGQTRRYTGVGPRTGDSTLFFFDFNAPDAASITWDGGGDGASWADAQNWALDRVPSADDNVAIAAAPDLTVVITDSVEVISVQSDAALTIQRGALHVSAASTVDGEFVIAPEAELRGRHGRPLHRQRRHHDQRHGVGVRRRSGHPAPRHPPRR